MRRVKAEALGTIFIAGPFSGKSIPRIWHTVCMAMESMGASWREIIMDRLDMERMRVVKVIDARWAPCPGPLLEAKEEIGHLKTGEVIEIQTVDPGAPGDISAWAGNVGHEFLGLLHSDGYDRIFVKKKRHVEKTIISPRLVSRQTTGGADDRNC